MFRLLITLLALVSGLAVEGAACAANARPSAVSVMSGAAAITAGPAAIAERPADDWLADRAPVSPRAAPPAAVSTVRTKGVRAHE